MHPRGLPLGARGHGRAQPRLEQGGARPHAGARGAHRGALGAQPAQVSGEGGRGGGRVERRGVISDPQGYPFFTRPMPPDLIFFFHTQRFSHFLRHSSRRHLFLSPVPNPVSNDCPRPSPGRSYSSRCAGSRRSPAPCRTARWSSRRTGRCTSPRSPRTSSGSSHPGGCTRCGDSVDQLWNKCVRHVFATYCVPLWVLWMCQTLYGILCTSLRNTVDGVQGNYVVDEMYGHMKRMDVTVFLTLPTAAVYRVLIS